MKSSRTPKKSKNHLATSAANRGIRRTIFVSFNFSDVEDYQKGLEIIKDLASYAGTNAAAEAKAAGLSRVYVRNNSELIKINADGNIILVSPRIKHSNYYVKYKPSTVLHAIKK